MPALPPEVMFSFYFFYNSNVFVENLKHGSVGQDSPVSSSRYSSSLQRKRLSARILLVRVRADAYNGYEHGLGIKT